MKEIHYIGEKKVNRQQFTRLRRKLVLERDNIISSGEVPSSAFSDLQKTLFRTAKTMKIMECIAREAGDRKHIKPYYMYSELEAEGITVFRIRKIMRDTY